MANALFDKGRNRFARGDLQWKVGGHVFKMMLVDGATYTPDLVNHEFFSDVPSTARKGNNAGNTRADMPALTLADPVAGVCDANDASFTTVTAGPALEYLTIFRDDGVADTSSPMVLFVDTATGLPITPNGANINVVWDAGANKIFKL